MATRAPTAEGFGFGALFPAKDEGGRPTPPPSAKLADRGAGC
jgi:hypothetical protein